MTDVSLRDYQLESVERARQGVSLGMRKLVLMAPAGAGKTEIACFMLQEAARKYSRAMFIVDRVVLVDQTSERLDRYGISHGVIQSGHWRWKPYERIQVCSAQTLERRGIPADVQVVFVDEAHCMRKKVTDFLNATDAVVIGLTATPFTKGMSKVYDGLVNVTTTNELIQRGYLSPLKIYAAKAIDTSGMKVVAGEWSEKEIEQRGLAIIGDIVAEWQDKTERHFGGPVKTIVFSATVDHGSELVRQFRAAGFDFRQISYKDGGDEERRAIIEEFRKPDSTIHGLVSCEVFTKGFDVPDVLCGISARPYRKSLSSHIQQMGRVMRASPGKEFGLWLCVARGSRVLTDRGLVPIEKVSLSDKIWDGTNFVTHGGAVCNGKQGTIRYQGLEATPGHLVHTQAGWRTFGECASQQIAITQTGLGGTPIREGEGHFAGRAVAGLEAQTVHSRRLRVRDVWLSGRHFAGELGRRANGWVQALRAACTGIPAMALCAGAGDARQVQEPEGCSVPAVRRTWNPVSILWSEGRDIVDHEEHRLPGARPLPSTGSDRPGRTLRAGEPALASGGAQPVKQERESGGCEAPQVQTGAPGDSLCGSDVDSVFLVRDERGGNHREVQQAVGETEREVWDILDCGPRNRFTCEGLLVHNCHSGNVMRFYADTEQVFAEGMHTLDDGKLESKVRSEPTEKERNEIKCACGCVLNARDVKCPACGKERIRRTLVEQVAGELVEIDGNKLNRKTGWDEKASFFAQVKAYAMAHNYNPGWAAHKYKARFGVWPNDPRVKNVAPATYGPEVSSWLRSQAIRYAKARSAA